MSNPDWWQTASQEEIRSVCHQVLRFPIGNHHDAFLTLANIGDAESVPLLVKSLKGLAGSDSTGFTICTTEHVIDALQSLTGQQFGFEPEKWEKWWAESGSKLPVTSFYPRIEKIPQQEGIDQSD